MLNFTINYIIASCLFNIPFYWFDLEKKMLGIIQSERDTVIQDLRAEDPNHPTLDSILSMGSTEDILNERAKHPTSNLFKNLIFFPVYLIFYIIIIIGRFTKK